jgi:hypothetical protein
VASIASWPRSVHRSAHENPRTCRSSSPRRSSLSSISKRPRRWASTCRSSYWYARTRSLSKAKTPFLRVISIRDQVGRHVRFWPILLKKSVARAENATIESKGPAIRINVAPTTGFLNQSCAATRSKSFFNAIGPQLPHAIRPVLGQCGRAEPPSAGASPKSCFSQCRCPT